MKCALCKQKECYDGKDCTDIKDKIEYTEEDEKSMRTSAAIEADHYMKKTRLEEIILYAKRMEYKRLGLAFCIGLENEARIIHNILAKAFNEDLARILGGQLSSKF